MYRIRPIQDKFITEKTVIKKGFFKDKKIWVPFLKYTGTEDVFVFDSFERALNALLNELKKEIYTNSRKFF